MRFASVLPTAEISSGFGVGRESRDLSVLLTLIRSQPSPDRLLQAANHSRATGVDTRRPTDIEVNAGFFDR